ncbi:hypothetical protein [Calothrix sp. UHCC 0171]|uniref:hypothetical protein n=1 Tax=Calothrix sp. UHCC 0171 TaxID=3110245 RepID=UPI002B20F6DA|nr:hypothetical protein [Calothrix sp. UHCC 0171]MEA5572598.1 hypothetical protein [Calothrix sp. UHCC 0171]
MKSKLLSSVLVAGVLLLTAVKTANAQRIKVANIEYPAFSSKLPRTGNAYIGSCINSKNEMHGFLIIRDNDSVIRFQSIARVNANSPIVIVNRAIVPKDSLNIVTKHSPQGMEHAKFMLSKYAFLAAGKTECPAGFQHKEFFFEQLKE